MTRWLNQLLLERVFAVKGEFTRGHAAFRRECDGVSIAPFLNNAEAAFSVSADFELNWAWRGLPPEDRDRLGRQTRANFPYLLEIIEETRIPVTWATVGHLFLDRCVRGPNGSPHPDMPRPPRNDWWSGDWYKHDPCTDASADPLWYSPDLIRALLRCSTPQEIGCHSFSHISFSAERCCPSLVHAEVMACRQAMAPYGLEPRSLVYPYNHMGHQFLDLLHQLGITVVRHRDPRVRLAYPQRSEAGVYLIYESMNLRRPRWYRYADKAAIHLRRARETRSSYHLWFHPSDPLSVVQTELASILRLAASLRDQGALWTASMKDLASYCEAREQAKLSVRWESNQAVIGLKVERDACLSDAGLLTLLVEKRAGTPRAWSISSGCTPQETPMTETLVGRGREGFRLNVPVTATTVTIRWS